MTDIIDILKELEHTKPGDPIPKCLEIVWMRPAEDGFMFAMNPESGTVISLSSTNNWGIALSAIAGAARAEIERLRAQVDDLTDRLQDGDRL